MKLLQINFKLSAPALEGEAARTRAKEIANLNGLVWKIYIKNDAEHLSGGIYLFEDEASAQAYLNGPIIASLKSMPVVSGFEAKIFDVNSELTKITRGPVDYFSS